MTIFEMINRIDELNAERDNLWKQACVYDEIPSYELFIVFSDDNPFLVMLNRVNREINRLRFELFSMAHPHAAAQYLEEVGLEESDVLA